MPIIAILAGGCTQFENAIVSEPHQRPNILFIMSDDHAYQAISAYDSTLISTPSIDRIADEGMLFMNASVTNSICAPSRATILTGKHCHMHGKIDNISAFDTSQMTFPQLFQKAGYQTSIFGKLHFGNNPKGIDEFAILPGQGDYLNPKFIVTNGDTIIKDGYATDIITDMSIDWLEENKDSDKPFLMMYFHKAPHRAWWPSPEKFEEFSKIQFPEPESLFDDYHNRGESAKSAEMNILEHMMLSYDCKVLPEVVTELGVETDPRDTGFFNWSYSKASSAQKLQYQPILDSIAREFKTNWLSMSIEQRMSWKYQRYIQDYLACISSVDENVGRVLDFLDDSGLAENTIVIYTSDQGFFLGEHGWFDKRFMYNESFKTPLMVRWPNEMEAGVKSDALVQNLDFAPTLLDAAGIDIPADMQGESLMPLLSGRTEEWSREAVYYHYYEYPGEHTVKRHYGIATKEFKLMHFYHDIDEWELYDLTKDPNEMNNVYDDVAYAAIKHQLETELNALRIKYNDSHERDIEFIDSYKGN